MELLLNLLWLLLAIPAYSLWRKSRAGQNHHGLTQIQCLLTLGCALVLLFPVVSATDDLHAMRAEMEESSKRSIRQASNEKSSVGQMRWHHPPAAAGLLISPVSLSRSWLEARILQPAPVSVPSVIRASRAPPTVFI